jgi:hypothetical protein
MIVVAITHHHPLSDNQIETKKLTTPAAIVPIPLGNLVSISTMPTTIPADTDITPLHKPFISFPPS